MTMSNPTEIGKLALLGREVRKALDEGLTGPTKLSPQVCAILDDWERYREEADNTTPNQWLSRVLGRRRDGKTRGTWVRYFRERFTASRRLGRAASGRLEHTLLVWCSKHLDDEQWRKVWPRLQIAARASGGVLTEAPGKELVADELGWETKEQACDGCVQLLERVRQLEARILELGGEVPE